MTRRMTGAVGENEAICPEHKERDRNDMRNQHRPGGWHNAVGHHHHQANAKENGEQYVPLQL